jgi:hypothetical protein
MSAISNTALNISNSSMSRRARAAFSFTGRALACISRSWQCELIGRNYKSETRRTTMVGLRQVLPT